MRRLVTLATLGHNECCGMPVTKVVIQTLMTDNFIDNLSTHGWAAHDVVVSPAEHGLPTMVLAAGTLRLCSHD